MNNNNTRNSMRNSIVAIALKLLQISFPFVSRTIVIRSLGLAYVGVSGLFSSIFGLMSIAELGVGSALLQSLYEPIKNKDNQKVRAILNFYKKAYFVIGVIITVIGLILMPFLKNIIKDGTYPANLNIYYIYITNLLVTIIGYLVYSYKALLLEANQRGSDANKIRILFSFIQYFIQIPALLITKNYYLYITVIPITTLLCSICIAKKCDQLFPGCFPVGTIDRNDKENLKSNIFALFLYKIGSVINNNVDGIVISVILGATVLGAFNNYYYVVSSVSALISVCSLAILPSLGSSFVNKTREEMFEVFKAISFLYAWIVGWCTICFMCLLEPFILLWAGKSTSQGVGFSILFAVYFYIWRFPDALSIIKDSLGLWRKDKWRPFCTAILNLVLNIALTRYIGLYGILLSTIIATIIINFPISMKVVMDYLDRKPKDYLIPQLLSVLVISLSGIFTYWLCGIIIVNNPFISIALKMIVCLLLPNLIYIFIYRNNNELRKIVTIIKR